VQGLVGEVVLVFVVEVKPLDDLVLRRLSFGERAN